MIKNTISDINNGIIQTMFLIADTTPSITNSIGNKTNNPIINNPFISTSVKPNTVSKGFANDNIVINNIIPDGSNVPTFLNFFYS